MALWQILDADGIAQPEQFDDGLAFMPGEDGYSTDAAIAEAAKIGGTFSLIGVPNWHARIEAEQKAAAEAEAEAAEIEAAAAREAAEAAQMAEMEQVAKARIAQLLDPEGTAKAQAEAALRAEHDTLAVFATGSEKTALKALFDERIEAL